ncbi:MAG TPA: hypothetical protein VK576_05200 [Thermoleophilia bacterium]|nr:hypothetical protein [Thermoleophilia bacterium]
MGVFSFFSRKDRGDDVGDDDVERLRHAYLALGPGLPAAARELFRRDGGSEGPWWRRAPRGKPRLIESTELGSADLFVLPPTWEIMRVVPRQIQTRHGTVTVTGFMQCRPKGSWEKIQVPFMHVWTLCRGRVQRFQNLLEGVELRPSEPALQRAA